MFALLFRYTPSNNGKPGTTGSIEIVEVHNSVKFFVQLPRFPEYHERVIRDGLQKKLRDEYGAPPKHTPAPKQELDAGSG